MIKLKQVRLINWYAFGQITVPIHSDCQQKREWQIRFPGRGEVCALWGYGVQ